MSELKRNFLHFGRVYQIFYRTKTEPCP